MGLIRYLSTQSGRIVGGQITNITPKVVTSLPGYSAFKPQRVAQVPSPTIQPTYTQTQTQFYGQTEQFQTASIPRMKRILPAPTAKTATKNLQSTFLDMMLNYATMDPTELQKQYTPGFIKKRVSELKDLAPSQQKAAAKIMQEYLDARVRSGGKTVEFFSKETMEDINRFYGEDQKYIQEMLNDPEVKDGFMIARSESFQKENFGKVNKATQEMLQPVIKRYEMLEKANKDLAPFYLAMAKDQNFGSFLRFDPTPLGGRSVESDFRYKRYIENFRETGVARPDLETVRRRRVVQNLQRDQRFQNIEEIFRSIDSGNEMEKNIEYSISYLDELYGDIQNGMESVGLKKDNREINKIVNKGKDAVYLAESVQRVIQSYGTEASVLNNQNGWDTIANHLYNMFYDMTPEYKARLIYRHTPKHNLFTIDQSIANQKPLEYDELMILEQQYDISVVYQDDNIMILRGMGEATDYEPLKRIPSPDYKLELPKQVLELLDEVDYMINYIEEPFPIQVRDGGFQKFNGDKYGSIIPDSVLTEEERLELAHDIQISAKVQMLGIFGKERVGMFFDEERIPTPRNAITSSLTSVVQHSSSRLLGRRHFFQGILRPSNVFKGTPAEAFKNYQQMVKAGMTPNIIYMAENSGRIYKYGIRTVKDMEHVFNNPGYIVVFSESYNYLMKHVDNYNLSPILKWIDTHINSLFKAGVFFLNIPLFLRNVLDTPIRAFFTQLPSESHLRLLELMGYKQAAQELNPELYKQAVGGLSYLNTQQMINRFQKHIENMGTLYDDDVMDAYAAGLNKTDRFEFNLMRTMAEMQVGGVPFEALLDILRSDAIPENDLARMFEEKAKSLRRKRPPGNIAEHVWNAPGMRQFMEAFGKFENLMRIHQALVWLFQGYTRPQIIQGVADTFVDYINKDPKVRTLGTVIPFGNFLVNNMYFWGKHAIDNPPLFRAIVQMATATTVDEERRLDERMSDFEREIASSGNFQIGNDVWMWNPSLFDALGAIPGFIKDPTGRMNLIIKNIGNFLKGDVESIEYPFQQPIERTAKYITSTIPKMMSGANLTSGEKYPGLVWTKNTFPSQYYPRRNYGYGTGISAYSRLMGYGSSKMGMRYGGRIPRSSNYQRKIYLDRGFYSSLYTTTGKSRIAIRSTQKPTYKNLAGRIKDQSYRFK